MEKNKKNFKGIVVKKNGKYLKAPIMPCIENTFEGVLTKEAVKKQLYDSGIIDGDIVNVDEVVDYCTEKIQEERFSEINIINEKDNKITTKPLIIYPPEQYEGELTVDGMEKYLRENNIIEENTVNPAEVAKGFLRMEADRRSLEEEKNNNNNNNNDYGHISQYFNEFIPDKGKMRTQNNLADNYDHQSRWNMPNMPVLNNAGTGGANKLDMVNSENNQAPSSKSEKRSDAKTKEIDAAEILLSHYRFVNTCGAAYFFMDGYYKLLTQNEAISLIIQCDYPVIKERGNFNFLKGIYNFILVHPYRTVSDDKENLKYLAFNDYVLNTETGQCHENNGDIFVTSKINCNYADCIDRETPVWDKYIDDVTGGDTNLKTLIMEVLGYYITNDINAQIFVVLWGGGATGKSLFGQFLSSLFNKEAISAIDIHDLGGKFEMYSVVGKKLNIAMDLPSGKISNGAASKIKTLTGNDLCKAEAKFENPFHFYNTCKFLFSSNFPVTTESYDSGFQRRMIVIPFIYGVPREKQDRNLLDKLLAEKEAIIYKALRYYIRLRSNNYVFTEIDMDWYIKKANDSYPQIMFKSADMILKEFIDTFCVLDTDGRMHNAVIYEKYKNYCETKGYVPYNTQQEFTGNLKKLIGNTARFKKIRIGDENKNGIMGLAFRE